MGYLLALIGMWLLSDAIYSFVLYVNAPSYDGKTRQTFKKDHFIRLIRGILAVIIIVIGWRLQ